MLLYYSFNQGIAGGDNTGISSVTDSKERFDGVLKNFALKGASSNFVGSLVLEAPTAIEPTGTNITSGSFTASWVAPAGTAADKYSLEVAKDAKFTNLVSGYKNLAVPGNQTSWEVTGLSPDVTYYYRVKVVSGWATSEGSNIISVKTQALTGLGNALNFDGSDDFVTISETGFTLPESGWTEEMWVYVPAVSPDVRVMGMVVIGGDDITVWSKRGPFFHIKNNTSLHGGYGYGTGQTQKTYDAVDALTVNAWNHIAQTYDGNRLKAYVNGKMVVDVEAPQKPNANPIKYLGQGVSDYYYPFKGSIDELRIWNRARSAEEIKNNYAKAVAPNDPDLLLYYSFNQGTAGGDNTGISSVTDSKGSFDGVLKNFALKGASSNFIGSLVLEAPTAIEPTSTNLTSGSFTASWVAPAGTAADKYRLEVAKDAKFTNLVPGYKNLAVPGNQTSWEVTGLDPDVTYYYRVKVVAGGATSEDSNIISVKTLALSVLGNVLSFDGDNDFVTMGAGLTLPESGWTEEMWIYLPAVSLDVRMMGMVVIGGDEMTFWSKRGPFFQVSNGKTLHGGYGYGTGQTQKTYDAVDALTVNAWNHIAQTYDGNRLKAYVNGKMVADIDAPEKPNANPIKYLGRGFFNIFYNFKGAMDEVRIWNRARSAEEIKNNYVKAVAPNDPDLLLYYSFNQGIAGGDNTSISSVTDSKGKFNGILNNFALKGTSSNFIGFLFLKAPTAIEPTGTNLTSSSFTASWVASAGTAADKYRLEVARDAKFTNLVPGYENLTVPGNQTSWEVTGLSPGVTYYYRVKVVSGSSTGEGSNIISVKTLALSGLGNALNFDGVDDFVTMGAGLTLPESGWTEEMWIYLPVVSLDVRMMGMMVTGGDDMTDWSKREPFLLIKNNTDLHGGYGYGTGETHKIYDARNALTVNAWNHLAQTYDGNRLKAYVNGKMVADVEAPEKPNANPIKYLGQRVSDRYYPFNGSIDELRIWNRARSADEIRDNYAKAVAPNDPDLLLYYSFNQGTAGGDNTGISSVTDSKGIFDGAFNNFALKGASSNFVGSLVLEAPTAIEPTSTNITSSSFTASWVAPAGTAADKYRLEVAKDAKFTNLVPGYENLAVPGNQTSWEVTGLRPDVTYYYRVKVVAGGATSEDSNIISVKTLALTDFGNALNFDGVDDVVVISETGFILPESGWTEEMWIYLPAVPPQVRFMGLIGGDNMTDFPKRGPFLQIASGKSLHGGYGYGTRGTQKTFDARNVLTVGAWNHLAQTYDGSKLKAYVNGKMVADVNAPEKPNANPIRYLGQGITDIALRFKGSIDEFRIWSRARTAEEIKNNYTKAVAPNDPDLIAYYDFNQGIAAGDNTGISSVTDNKRKSHGKLDNFSLKRTRSNFVASLSFEKPTAIEATNITGSSFTAIWAVPAGTVADNYILEVAGDAGFTSPVPGYENLMVPGNQTSKPVIGLTPDVAYYYRVKAVEGGVISPNSNIIPVKTLVLTELGNALNFDGVNDFVTMGAGITFPENEWTEEMWIYVPSGIRNMELIGSDDMDQPSKSGPFLHVINGNDLRGGYGNRETQKTFRIGDVLTIGDWNHVAQTFDGSRLKIYVNGNLVTNGVVPGVSNVNPIKYLGRGIPGVVDPFKGAMDEVRIWNRARSADEIRDNYKINIDKNHPDLLAYYDFNQGIAGGNNTVIETLIDNKGAYNATLNNFTKTGATSNFVGDLNLTPPVASQASGITPSLFTAGWAMAAGSSPTPDKYFLDVSTDETFADESKFVSGYRNKNVGNVTEYAVTELNSGTAYYYRLRAGYADPWYQPSVNSNTIKVKTLQTNNIALAATAVKVYGDAPYQLAVSSSGTGAYTYTITEGDAVSISNTGQVTVLKAGIATLVVKQVADAVYDSAGSVTQTITVQPKGLTVTATAADKEYDGANAAGVTLLVSGTVNRDEVRATAEKATFNNKDVGAGKPVTVTGITLSGAKAGNYVLANSTATSTGNITAKPVTVTFRANSKPFDRNVAATGEFTVDGKVSGDEVTVIAKSIFFNDANVGANKPVLASGISLKGSDQGNYRLTNTTAASTAAISGKGVTVSINKVAGKVYDGNTTASATFDIIGLAAEEPVTVISADVSFSDKNVGVGKAVTAGNFKFSDANYSAINTSATSTGNIAAKPVTVTFRANSKPFDRNAAATGEFTVEGKVLGDEVTVIAKSIFFNDANVGANKPVLASEISLKGSAEGNYRLTGTRAESTANISGKGVTVSINKVAGKVYDGNTTASATFNIIGLAAGETLTVISADVSFSDKNVGVGKVVTAGNFKFSDANYSAINTSATSTGNITAKPVTVTFRANSKPFDRNAAATGEFTVEGKIAGDEVTVIAKSIFFNDANVGANKPVLASGISLKGSDQGNYKLTGTTAAATANISGKGVTVSINKVAGKVYDGNTTASATFNIIGLAAEETLTVISADVSFSDKNVGVGKAVTAGNFKLSDANYSAINTTATSTGNISPKDLTITADNKAKLPSEDNPPLTAGYSGFVSGENNTNALTVQPLLTTSTTEASLPGNYPIEVSGAVAANSNYNIIYNKGTLTISTVAITALTLTTNTLYSNCPAGILAGTLAGRLTASSTDPKAIYTYSLVPEAGDNGKFTIKGDKLFTNALLNFETPCTFTVKVQASTQWRDMLTKDFILTVLYVNGSPTLDAIADQSVCATTDSHTINLSGITPGPEAGQTTTLSIAGSNKDMFNALSVTQLSGGKGIINYSLKAGVTVSAVVTVTVKDDGGTADGGVDTYSVSFTVNVNPLPAISISTGTGKLRVVRGRTIDLTANAPGATAYSWANAKGIVNDRNTAKLTVKPTERTVYTVKATSTAGCSDVKQIIIEVGSEYSDVVANNIITPNGDGVNDVWVIENIEHYPNATVKVFDRAGHLVFSQTNYDNKWNGYFKGKPLQRGTYYYAIDFGKGKNLTSKGYITIINEQ